MSAEEHRRSAPSALGFAAITISDTRTAADDLSGQALAERIEAAGHRIVWQEIVPDEVAAIREVVERALGNPEVDVIVTTGGTGFSPRDVTIEAVSPFFDRPIEGFGELFRHLSFEEVGAAAMLSRATAGLVGTRAVFLLPGSPKAVDLALDRLILPEAGHLLSQARRGAVELPRRLAPPR